MRKETNRKIFYLEPTFFCKEGHKLETMKILYPYLQQYGQLEIYGGSNVSRELASKYGIIPYFESEKDMPLYTFFRTKRGIWRICKYLSLFNWKYQIRKTCRELAKIVEKADSDSIFFFPTCNFVDLLAALRILRQYKNRGKWGFILRNVPDIQEKPLFPQILKIRKEFENNCCFFSDSELVIQEYEKRGLSNIKLLPIPHLPAFQEKAIGTSVKIAYLGSVREEKGFGHLPNLIQYFKNRNMNIDFFIQASGFTVMWTDWERRTMGAVLEKLHLLAENAPNVTICEKHLESEDYYAHLNECDIILLPYKQRDKRYYATSGILAEAMALGKVAVVPADTWLARQIERSGGGVIFDSPEELPQKVAEAIRNFESLHQKAVAFVPEWRSFHNIENYMKILMENL